MENIDEHEDTVKVGVSFKNQENAEKSIEEWQKESQCPLSKARITKSGVNKNGNRTRRLRSLVAALPF